MTPPVGPPPTKKRKVNKGEISSCNEKDLRKLLCKRGDDRKKVLERASERLQDVTVTFYCASEVASFNKKGSKFKNDWNDLKQGERGVLQTAHGFIKKSREDMTKASCATYRDQLKYKPHNSSYRRSTLLKTQNLIDLLPLSQFHSVRKRTFSCKIDHIRNDASSYSPREHVSEPTMGVLTDRDTYWALPISVEAVQRGGSSPLVSHMSERKAAENDIIHGVDRKPSEKRTPNLDFNCSVLDEGDMKLRGKFTRAYVRKKFRVPLFKDESPDLYALHLLADTALNLESDPKFQVPLQNQKGSLVQECNEHTPLSTNRENHASIYANVNGGMASTSKSTKGLYSEEVCLNEYVSPAVDLFQVPLQNQKGSLVQECNEHTPLSTNNENHASIYANVNGGQASTSKATKDLYSEEVCLNEYVPHAVGFLLCTSINEKHNSNQSIEKKVEEMISRDGINIDSHMDDFHLTKDASLSEHREIIDETVAVKEDINLKKDSQSFKEIDPVFISKNSVCHDKVSSSWCQLEPCNSCHGNSLSILRCMETPQNVEGCLKSSSGKRYFYGDVENTQNTKECSNSFNINNLINQSPDYHVRGVVQSSKQKAFKMVDVAIKVMSSMKVGEDAYTIVGEALDSSGIQEVGLPSRILGTEHCFNPQNGGPGNCHHDLSCSLAEVEATTHSINSTVPTLPRNDSQIPTELISACVAALFMIQESSERSLPPAEVMEILDQAARGLQPQFSENIQIYKEIQDLMSIIKTQMLSFVRTPSSNLQL